MNAEERRNAVTCYEGQVLTIVGNCGPEYACDMARCAVDGAINALMRIEGAQETARFAFNVVDRVVETVRDATEFTPVATIAMESVVSAEEKPASRWPHFAVRYLVWWLCGFAAASIIAGLHK